MHHHSASVPAARRDVKRAALAEMQPVELLDLLESMDATLEARISTIRGLSDRERELRESVEYMRVRRLQKLGGGILGNTKPDALQAEQQQQQERERQQQQKRRKGADGGAENDDDDDGNNLNKFKIEGAKTARASGRIRAPVRDVDVMSDVSQTGVDTEGARAFFAVKHELSTIFRRLRTMAHRSNRAASERRSIMSAGSFADATDLLDAFQQRGGGAAAALRGALGGGGGSGGRIGTQEMTLSAIDAMHVVEEEKEKRAFIVKQLSDALERCRAEQVQTIWGSYVPAGSSSLMNMQRFLWEKEIKKQRALEERNLRASGGGVGIGRGGSGSPLSSALLTPSSIARGGTVAAAAAAAAAARGGAGVSAAASPKQSLLLSPTAAASSSSFQQQPHSQQPQSRRHFDVYHIEDGQTPQQQPQSRNRGANNSSASNPFKEFDFQQQQRPSPPPPAQQQQQQQQQHQQTGAKPLFSSAPSSVVSGVQSSLVRVGPTILGGGGAPYTQLLSSSLLSSPSIKRSSPHQPPASVSASAAAAGAGAAIPGQASVLASPSRTSPLGTAQPPPQQQQQQRGVTNNSIPTTTGAVVASPAVALSSVQIPRITISKAESDVHDDGSSIASTTSVCAASTTRVAVRSTTTPTPPVPPIAVGDNSNNNNSPIARQQHRQQHMTIVTPIQPQQLLLSVAAANDSTTHSASLPSPPARSGGAGTEPPSSAESSTDGSPIKRAADAAQGTTLPRGAADAKKSIHRRTPSDGELVFTTQQQHPQPQQPSSPVRNNSVTGRQKQVAITSPLEQPMHVTTSSSSSFFSLAAVPVSANNARTSPLINFFPTGLSFSSASLPEMPTHQQQQQQQSSTGSSDGATLGSSSGNDSIGNNNNNSRKSPVSNKQSNVASPTASSLLAKFYNKKNDSSFGSLNNNGSNNNDNSNNNNNNSDLSNRKRRLGDSTGDAAAGDGSNLCLCAYCMEQWLSLLGTFKKNLTEKVQAKKQEREARKKLKQQQQLSSSPSSPQMMQKQPHHHHHRPSSAPSPIAVTTKTIAIRAIVTAVKRERKKQRQLLRERAVMFLRVQVLRALAACDHTLEVVEAAARLDVAQSFIDTNDRLADAKDRQKRKLDERDGYRYATGVVPLHPSLRVEGYERYVAAADKLRQRTRESGMSSAEGGGFDDEDDEEDDLIGGRCSIVLRAVDVKEQLLRMGAIRQSVNEARKTWQTWVLQLAKLLETQLILTHGVCV